LQQNPLGSAQAVLLAKNFVNGEATAVLFVDDITIKMVYYGYARIIVKMIFVFSFLK